MIRFVFLDHPRPPARKDGATLLDTLEAARLSSGGARSNLEGCQPLAGGRGTRSGLTPPVGHAHERSIPEGCQRRPLSQTRAGTPSGCIASGGRFRGYRSAQPPANGGQPSGLEHSSLS